MARYLWLIWSAVMFHLCMNFLLQERTNITPSTPSSASSTAGGGDEGRGFTLEVLPFKIWLAQRSDVYVFGALLLPLGSALAMVLLALHVWCAHGASHLDHLPAVIDREKVRPNTKNPNAKPLGQDRMLDLFLRLAWPLVFTIIAGVASRNFVCEFMHHDVYSHSAKKLYFAGSWTRHLGHFALNPFRSDLRFGAVEGVTYIAGWFPWIATMALATFGMIAIWWIFIWLPKPLWTYLVRRLRPKRT